MPGLLIHEWISRSGGSEKVVQAMANAFPEADLFCLWNDDKQFLPSREIRESWIANTPLRRSKLAALPLMPFIWQSIDARNYDWTIISSHLFAHHALGAVSAMRRYVYVHTPARYIWEPGLDGRGNSASARLVAHGLRQLDRRRAQAPSEIAANSRYVQERIARCWGRDSVVIYPPVDVDRLTAVRDWCSALNSEDSRTLETLPETFILGASRFVQYKGLDKVIAGAAQIGLPAVIAGAGPEEGRLRQLAAESAVPVHFVIRPSTELLYALYQRALVYVFPAIEDFGIMPVEAMAVGTPVVVNAIGGTTESVLHQETGIHLDSWTGKEIATAISKAASLRGSRPAERANSFARSSFEERIREWVSSV